MSTNKIPVVERVKYYRVCTFYCDIVIYLYDVKNALTFHVFHIQYYGFQSNVPIPFPQ